LWIRGKREAGTETSMKRNTENETGESRDASLRVSKRVRDSLKAAAAVMGRPLYDVTNEAISEYLAQLRIDDSLAAIRKAGRSRAEPQRRR
jgi:hypothetical protein